MKTEEKVKIIEDFYGQCAEILGTEHVYREPASRPTRWGPRTPGNGRFPDFGMIRLFWPNTVQINLLQPKRISITIEGRQKALDYLREEIENE